MLVWEGSPFEVASNRRLVAVRAGRRAKQVQRSTYKKASASMAEAFAAGWDAEPLSGPVVVEVRSYWQRRHRQGAAAGLAMGDVDAPAKSVLDALQAAGVLDDDASVRRLICEKDVDKDRPRIEVEVRLVEGDQ